MPNCPNPIINAVILTATKKGFTLKTTFENCTDEPNSWYNPNIMDTAIENFILDVEGVGKSWYQHSKEHNYKVFGDEKRREIYIDKLKEAYKLSFKDPTEHNKGRYEGLKEFAFFMKIHPDYIAKIEDECKKYPW